MGDGLVCESTGKNPRTCLLEENNENLMALILHLQRLQSVKGLAHGHVFARKKSDAEVVEWRSRNAARTSNKQNENLQSPSSFSLAKDNQNKLEIHTNHVLGNSLEADSRFTTRIV